MTCGDDRLTLHDYNHFNDESGGGGKSTGRYGAHTLQSNQVDCVDVKWLFPMT